MLICCLFNLQQSPKPSNTVPLSTTAPTTASNTQTVDDEDSISEFDIAKYVGREWRQDERQKKFDVMKNLFTPDDKYTFPLRKCGQKNRAFQFAWLKEFPGLAYSPSEDAAYCKHCVFFPRNGICRGQLVTVPFTNWKKSSEKCIAHFFGDQKDKTKRGTGECDSTRIEHSMFTIHVVLVLCKNPKCFHHSFCFI